MKDEAKPLLVCSKCGWYTDEFGHQERCDSRAGAAAEQLVEKLTAIGVKATKLGYGDKTVTMLFAENMTMIFGARVDWNNRATFSHERTFLHGLNEQVVLEMAEHLRDLWAEPSKPSTKHDCPRDADCEAQLELEEAKKEIEKLQAAAVVLRDRLSLLHQFHAEAKLPDGKLIHEWCRDCWALAENPGQPLLDELGKMRVALRHVRQHFDEKSIAVTYYIDPALETSTRGVAAAEEMIKMVRERADAFHENPVGVYFDKLADDMEAAVLVSLKAG